METAAGLIDLGVGAGDVIGIAVRSGPDFVATFFGALAAGATPCPVATPGVLGAARSAGSRVEPRDPRGCHPFPWPTGPATPGSAGVPAVAPAALRRLSGAPVPGPAPDGLGLIQLTSGSTGAGKAVAVGVAALEANVAGIAHWLEWTRDDPVASWLPLFHDMGLIGCLITPIVMQSDLWLLRPSEFVRNPVRYLRCLGERGATLTAMPDFGLRHIVGAVDASDLAGLRFDHVRAVIVGAEPLRTRSFDVFHELLGPHGLARRALRPAYGLAEATLAVTGLACDREWRSAGVDTGARRVIGCGRPLPGVTVEIVDGDGHGVADGSVGEIVVSGPSLARGYLGDPNATDAAFAGGALRTGDAGFPARGRALRARPAGRLAEGQGSHRVRRRVGRGRDDRSRHRRTGGAVHGARGEPGRDADRRPDCRSVADRRPTSSGRAGTGERGRRRRRRGRRNGPGHDPPYVERQAHAPPAVARALRGGRPNGHRRCAMTTAGEIVFSESEREVDHVIRDLIFELAPNPEGGEGHDDPRLVEELEYHSLGLMELAFTLEDEFELEPIDEETAVGIATVGDVVRHVVLELRQRAVTV